jgi:hypothetical protein
MAQLADDLGPSRANGSKPDVAPELADLAERMRSTVTPVVGYLELISQDANGMSRERHLEWISTIERRLDAMRETSDQISKICDVLRQSISDREASTPRAPEAPGD